MRKSDFAKLTATAIATVAVSLSPAGAVAPGAAAPDLSNVPLIPRTSLFGNPVKSAGKISPDGKSFAFIAPRDGVMNLWVAPIGDVAAAKPLTAETKRPIRQYFWSPDSRQQLFINDAGGDENFLPPVDAGWQRALDRGGECRIGRQPIEHHVQRVDAGIAGDEDFAAQPLRGEIVAR